MRSQDAGRAENQNMARSANTRLQDVAGRTVQDGKVIPFLCECAADACLGRVDITIDDYFISHLDSNHYVVIPGHPRIEGEVLVGDHGKYQVVTKAAV